MAAEVVFFALRRCPSCPSPRRHAGGEGGEKTRLVISAGLVKEEVKEDEEKGDKIRHGYLLDAEEDRSGKKLEEHKEQEVFRSLHSRTPKKEGKEEIR